MSNTTEFVQSLGFSEDPFAHTNADNESRLQEYFVKPPYFEEVFGDPDNPQSFFVFAPRGGGKSAQRIMIEKKCAESNVLSLTYDDFDLFPIRNAKEAKLEHHIRRILRIGFVGLLVSLDDEPAKVELLSKEEKSLLAKRIELHVENLSFPEFEATLKSLRSITDKIGRFFDKYRPYIGTAANAITQRILDTNALLPYAGSARLEEFNSKYELELLGQYARKIGYKSVYVLVDKVDESELTGNSAIRSFELLEPMVRSLHILETDGIAFKFFLWDAIEPRFAEVARPDRIRYRKLKWDNGTLKTLLQKRLMAFSNRTVRKLDSVADSIRPYDLDELAVLFANRSPRDLIRVCQKIVAEQQQSDSRADLLGKAAIYKGIDEFCDQRVEELYESRHMQRFRRIGSYSNHVDFTIGHLANDVFKEKQVSTRNWIKQWKDSGMIADLGRIASTTGNKVKLYGVRDVRLARAMGRHLGTEEFLRAKIKACPNCQECLIRDVDESDSNSICQFCGYDWATEQISSDFNPYLDEESDHNGPQQRQLL